MPTDKLRVLIADGSKVTTRMIDEYLKQKDDMDVVAIAKDGETTCKKIDLYKPDVVILDVIMPKIDGIEVLKRYHTKENSPAFIVLSSIGLTNITEEVFKYGAQYYIMKPFQPDILYKRIHLITGKTVKYPRYRAKERITQYKGRVVQNKRGKKLDSKLIADLEVTKLLHQIGIPSNIKGFKYIKEAVFLVLKDWEAITAVTKEIYPVIARKHYTSKANVERAIRHSLDVAWDKGSLEGKVKVFGKEFDCTKKMKNAEAIANLSSKLNFILKEQGINFEE